MTIKDFLKGEGLDLDTNKCKYANQLKGDLGLSAYEIDFNKDISEMTEEDYYQLGSSLIEKKKPMSKSEIIDEMKSKINK